MEIVFFDLKAKRFFQSLDSYTGPKMVRLFDLLEQYGNDLRMPYSKSLGSGLFELRATGAIQIRFIYAFHNHKIWILHAFVKKTPRTPRADLNYARKQFQALVLI